MSAYSTHKKAHFDYEILETFEAGIMLTGQEVKSIRKGSAKLEGAFVIIRGSEPYLTNVHIPPFQVKNAPKGYDSERPRKLLLSKKEIARIEQETEKMKLDVEMKRINEVDAVNAAANTTVANAQYQEALAERDEAEGERTKDDAKAYDIINS